MSEIRGEATQMIPIRAPWNCTKGTRRFYAHPISCVHITLKRFDFLKDLARARYLFLKPHCFSKFSFGKMYSGHDFTSQLGCDGGRQHLHYQRWPHYYNPNCGFGWNMQQNYDTLQCSSTRTFTVHSTPSIPPIAETGRSTTGDLNSNISIFWYGNWIVRSCMGGVHIHWLCWPSFQVSHWTHLSWICEAIIFTFHLESWHMYNSV